LAQSVQPGETAKYPQEEREIIMGRKKTRATYLKPHGYTLDDATYERFLEELKGRSASGAIQNWIQNFIDGSLKYEGV
jgi:hypothetical protein